MKDEGPLRHARWIHATVRGGKRTSAPAPCLRREFRIERPVRDAKLAITALGLYDCEINGKRVGDHVLAPGWTVYGKRVAYQVYDVRDLLREGANVIGIILGDGWYCGHLAVGPREVYGEYPELLCCMNVTFPDESKWFVASDADWKTATGPILESDILMGETYDERRDLGDWTLRSYNDSAWAPVHVSEDKPISLERSPAPPVRRIEEIECVSQTAIGETRILDFGQNFAGRVRIKFEGKPGQHIIIRHAEMLNPDGSLYTENLRGAKATDQYTCAGEGPVEWEPRFTFHGFRYVSVDGLDEDATCDATGIVLHNDMPVTGTFRCSSDLLNQLEHNILWGQKSNFLEVPTDCPQRDERLGWTGDAQVFVRTAAYHMDVSGFFRKWLQDVRDEQGPGGGIPSFVPNLSVFNPRRDGGPAWGDAALICPWTIYLCYGDKSIVEDHYDCMTRYMDCLAENKVKDGIRAHPDVDDWGGYGDWLALDDSGKTDGGTPKDLIGTAFYANNADIMARAAELLGKSSEAEKYRELHGNVVTAFRDRFIDKSGKMPAGTQTAYVLALHFGLMPEDLRDSAANELVRDIEKRGMHLATGFVGTPYLLDVLEETGHLDVAYKLLEQETFPSWLFPVKNGATTIWERWDGWTPDKGFQDPNMNSFNHYAYGAVGAWMMRSVAGLDCDVKGPGYRHTIFRPRPGGTLTWAEASLDTPNGRIRIRWEIEGATLKVEMEVAEGIIATFSPPPAWNGEEETLPAGSHVRELSAR